MRYPQSTRKFLKKFPQSIIAILIKLCAAIMIRPFRRFVHPASKPFPLKKNGKWNFARLQQRLQNNLSLDFILKICLIESLSSETSKDFSSAPDAISALEYSSLL